MNEQVKTEGVAEEAVVAVKAAPAAITFEELNAREVAFVPVSDNNGMVRERDVRIVFGKRTRIKAGQPTQVSGWWKAEIKTVFDGMEKVLEGAGAKPQQAVSAVLRMLPGTVTLDMYVEPDWADEFFAQKIEAPAKPAMTWDERLLDLRAKIESTLEQQDEAAMTALDSAVNIGEMLVSIRKEYKLNNKDLVLFVQGEGLGDNARSMPKLVKLMRGGALAIAEAAFFGEVHPKVLEVLPYEGGTSGKALYTNRQTATRAMVEASVEAYMAEVSAEAGDSEPVYLPAMLDGEKAFDAQSAARMLRHILRNKQGYGVAGALDDVAMPFSTLQKAADDAADAYSRDFRERGGRFFSTYNAEDRESTQRALALTVHAYSGSEFAGAHGVALAIDNITRHAAKEQTKDPKIIAEGLKLLNGKKMNPLIAIAREVILREAKHKKVQKQVNDVLDRIEEAPDDGDNVVKKGARKTFASLSVEEGCMKLFSLLTSHPGQADILKALVKLHAQHMERQLKKPNAEPAVEGDASED